MLILKNITYDELLDFAAEIINEHSIERENDLVQIVKFRNLIKDKAHELWLPLIEGWVVGLGVKYNISIETYIRKKKLDKINEI